MTEELVKKFEKWLRKYILCNNCKKKCTCIQLNAYCEEQVKQAYIAGATENGVQWHDLRKDPNDLPKENELYLVFGYTNKREKFYELDVFDPKEGEFLGCGEYVYAWCEIPTFKE